MTLKQLNKLIYESGVDISQLSDGYHTFETWNDIRKAYNAALFNEWAAQGRYNVHKSRLHHDGSGCFDGNWFIVVAILPTGQISNHYKLEDWDLFQCPAVDKALFPFDGHTTADVIDRLKKLGIRKSPTLFGMPEGSLVKVDDSGELYQYSGIYTMTDHSREVYKHRIEWSHGAWWVDDEGRTKKDQRFSREVFVTSDFIRKFTV